MSVYLITVHGERLLTAGGGGPVTLGGDELTLGGEALTLGAAVEQFHIILAPRFVPSTTIRAAPVYSLDLCTGFRKVGEGEAYRFDAVVRHLAKGQWKLTAPLSGVSCPDVDAVDSVIVWDQTEPARIVFAGIVRRVPGVDGARVRVLTESDDSIEWTGVDLYGVLAQRQVWPTPSTGAPWADAFDERTGVGSTVAAEYIAANIGSTAILGRRVPNLVIVDAEAGSSSTWSGRMQPLDEFVGRICRESGIGCTASMPSIGVIQYTLRALQDHSASLVISDQGDLESLSRLVTPAEATHVIGAGQGELSARAFATASTGATGLERVEQVYENTNISTADGLLTATNTELALGAADVSVDGAVAESAAQQIRYLDDYHLGDWLGVEVDGVRYTSQVEAVTFTLSPEREVVRPVLGRSSTNRLSAVLRDVAGISSRLDRQIA